MSKMELLLFAAASCLLALVVNASSSPWKHETILAQSGGSPNTNLGESVAINADGMVVLASSTFRSGAIVFTKQSGGVWDNQPLLEGNTVESLALSADGNTVLLGTPRVYENGEWNDVGAAWVFTKQNNTYALEATLLAGNAVIGLASKQGASVALSRNGNTALIGAPQDDPRFDPSDDYGGYGYLGATYVYTRNTNTKAWSRQQKLVHSKAYCLKKTTCLAQGHRVALSGNGNYALVYANLPSEADETTFLFVRNANTNKWTEQAKKFVGGQWGFTMSRTGTRMVIGGTGAFERTNSGTKWQTRQGMGSAWNAGPTAMNANGDLVVVGMDVYYGNREMAYGRYAASKWERVGTVNLTGGFRANAVGMSEDGNVLVVGNGAGVRVLQSTLDTATPTQFATAVPSTAPITRRPTTTTANPTVTPTSTTPSMMPTLKPSMMSTLKPSVVPTSTPSMMSTSNPTEEDTTTTQRPLRFTFPPFTRTPTISSSTVTSPSSTFTLLFLLMFMWW